VLLRLAGVALILAALGVQPGAQSREALPDALQQMVETERAFAARALVIGWKDAFLEYVSDTALGFDQGMVGLAKVQIQKNPDPPKDLRLVREPRLGDVAGSGEIGYLTGPAQTVLPSRNNGRPRHSTYTSVWKRERNGRFRVVMDAAVPTPSAVPFTTGFTRAAYKGRFTGDYDESTPPLGTADSVLNSALRTNQSRAWRGRLAEGSRLHRPDLLPLVGDRNIARWAASQPPYALADTRFAEAARSGDLGYTWGTYVIAARPGTREEGFYVRIWVRDRDGQWKLALDVLQPQTAPDRAP
jgi:ketosteroid isomerase-like protein